MTILSDTEIRYRIEKQRLVEGVKDMAEQLQPSSLDVRLDRFVKKPEPGSVDFAYRSTIDQIVYNNFDLRGDNCCVRGHLTKGFYIAPGDFILASTVESVNIPDDIVCVVNGKSTLGRLGIFIHVTAGYVDPGFSGNITLEIYNGGPHGVILQEDMMIAQLVFHHMSTPCMKPYGSKGSNNKYHGQQGVTAPKGSR